MQLKKIISKFFLFLIFLVSINVKAQIIPEDLLMDWEPGVNVGVQGGIPSRTTIGATVDAATYGTGSIDASGAIEAAIDACPEGQIVFIPEGTYRLNNRVYRPSASNITIRGAGQGQTILKAEMEMSQVMLLVLVTGPGQQMEFLLPMAQQLEVTL